MSPRARTTWNIITNTSGVVVNLLAGLIVMPYLIRQLGASTYGLWSLIGSLTGYFGVLDFGVRPSLGRLIATSRARGEVKEVNAVVSTGIVLLAVVAVLVACATLGVLKIFPKFFPVPVGQVADVRHSILIVGINIAFTFPAATFDAFLWGYERFDISNAIDIPAITVRTALLLTAVSTQSPLTSLAVIVLATNLLSACCKGWICFRIEPRLRVGRSGWRRRLIREIYSYGGWMSIISWSRTLIPQIAPTVIGHRIGTSAVTTFAVARQLVAYTDVFTVSATQVLTPRAIAAHATDATETQKRLFLQGGRLSCALTIYFSVGLLLLGGPFIHLWQHGGQDSAYWLMLILLLGELLPMSQWLTYSVLIGANRHRFIAWMAAGEFLTLAGLLALARWNTGVAGICTAVAVSGFAFRGLVRWLYGCRLMRVSVFTYAKYVFASVTVAAAPAAAVLYTLVSLSPPTSFVRIIVAGLTYSVVFVAVVGATTIGYAGLKNAVSLLLPNYQRPN